MGQKMDRFKPISFPLAIVTVDDIGPFSPVNLARQVSKVVRPYRFKKHGEILAHAAVTSGRGLTLIKTSKKMSAA